MSIKHLTPRSPEEIENNERSLFSGKLLKDMSYDELVEIVNLVWGVWHERVKKEMKIRRKEERKAAKAGFYRGQIVRWSNWNGNHEGIITRLNPMCASVKENSGTKWKVSYNRLNRE